MRTEIRACVVLLVLFTSCCGKQPNTRRAADNVNVGVLYSVMPYTKAHHFSTTELPRASWWGMFQDELLVGIVESTIQHNTDIRIAKANIATARLVANAAQTAFNPFISLRASAAQEGSSQTTVLPLKDRGYVTYNTGFDVSWELDIFQKNSPAIKARVRQANAALENYRNIMVSVVAEAVRYYLETIALQETVKILKNDLQAKEEVLDALKRQQEIGMDGIVDLTKAKAAVEQAKAKIAEAEGSFFTAVLRLSVIANIAPEQIIQKILLARCNYNPDVIPVGIPAQIIRRRPDIRRAEQELFASEAELESVVAQLYPSFILGNFTRLESAKLGDLLKTDSLAWSVRGLLNWPIFQQGAIRAQVVVEKSKLYTTGIQFEQVLVDALEDIERSMIRYSKSLTAYEHLMQKLAFSQQVLDLAMQQRLHGQTSLLDALQAKQQFYLVQEQLETAKKQTLVDLVSVFKALGGDWGEDTPMQGAAG